MSILVRLIGGQHDGEVVKVDDDQVEIVKRRTFPGPATRAFNATYGIGSDTAEVKSSRYTRREVRTPGGSVAYFAIEAFSDLEALQHALGP